MIYLRSVEGVDVVLDDGGKRGLVFLVSPSQCVKVLMLFTMTVVNEGLCLSDDLRVAARCPWRPYECFQSRHWSTCFFSITKHENIMWLLQLWHWSIWALKYTESEFAKPLQVSVLRSATVHLIITLSVKTACWWSLFTLVFFMFSIFLGKEAKWKIASSDFIAEMKYDETFSWQTDGAKLV